ncbi:MAG: hypothetical protein AABY22_10745 [Nanoarchaeota archaeon]
MKTETEQNILKEKNLGQLISEINSLFKVHKKQDYSIIMWSLVCWQNGYWSIQVTDDWHKWLDCKIEQPNLQYVTPELACNQFLSFIKNKKINIKKLQSK